MNSIIAGAIYAVVALGFNLIYGTVKFFDIGYGSLTAVGGYTVFLLYKRLGFDLAISIIAAMIVAGLVGYLIYRFVYAPLRARKATNMVMLVASLGAFIIIQAVVAMLFTSQFQTLSRDVAGVETYQIFGGIITQTQTLILAAGLLIMTALAFVLKYTLFGKAVRAVSDDDEVARIVERSYRLVAPKRLASHRIGR